MKICFVSPNIYPLLSCRYEIERIGGAELQQAFIGKALSNIGYDVSYITSDFNQPEIEVLEGIKVYKTFKEHEGIPVFRFFYPRLLKIWKALIKANADVYYVRTASFLTGILSIFCGIYQKAFVFSAGHDTDFIPDQIKIRISRDKLLYKYGLRRAHAILTQSDFQKRLLWENFGLKGIVIRNIDPGIVNELPTSKRRFILWVSTIRQFKNPMRFVRLAQAIPEEEFVMIGGPNNFDLNLYKKVEKESLRIENLSFLGFQSYQKTEEYFNKCKIFINTSDAEGFPNTFLQAWRRGIPVVSYVNPDNVITTKKLGLVVKSERDLKEAVHSLIDSHFWESAPIIDYFMGNHSDRVVQRYVRLLQNIMSCKTKKM